MSVFAIFDLALGNGVVGLCPFPGVSGSRSADFAGLLRWRPDLVLSLTPAKEMTELGLGDLAALLGMNGISWLHFPIVDYGIPSAQQNRLWPPISGKIADTLRTGGRVVIHCRGGCGRTGMVVLRAMVEAGEEPTAALARLRSVRPCAVETERQRDWGGGEP